MVDDSDGFGFPSSCYLNLFCSKHSSSSIYIYSFLNMVKLFKKISKFIQRCFNILIRLILSIVYFILILPFAISIKLFTDFLGIKNKVFHWNPLDRIDDISRFLSKQ